MQGLHSGKDDERHRPDLSLASGQSFLNRPCRPSSLDWPWRAILETYYGQTHVQIYSVLSVDGMMQ